MTSGHWYARILSSSPQNLLTTVETVLEAENLQLKPAVAKSLLGPLRSAAAAGVFPVPLPFPLATTFAQVKKQAKVLYDALCSSGNDVNLTTSQHILAKFYSYSSWQHFAADARKTSTTRKANRDDADEPSLLSLEDRRRTVAFVYNWLLKKIGHFLPFIEKEFYTGLTTAEVAKLKFLPEERRNVLILNRADWLLADAVLPGDDRPLIGFYLGPDGPVLSKSQKRWLEKMAHQSLRLYEIKSVKPGEGFMLRDMVDDSQPLRWVMDDLASKALEKGDAFAGRLVPDGDWVLSGCVYSYDEGTAADIANRMKESISMAMKVRKCSFEDAYDYIAARILPGAWLGCMSTIAQLPHVVDAATGEDLAMVFDTYAIRNLGSVVGVFKERHDVDGDVEGGWARIYTKGSDVKQASTMKIDAEGNLEVWSQSVGMADQTKWWMDTALGAAVAYRSRRIVESGSDEFWEMMEEAISEDEARPAAERAIEREIGAQFLKDHYRKWLDMPLPGLKGKTPREAAKTPGGRKELEALLQYMAGLKTPEPIDFEWLRGELGLAH